MRTVAQANLLIRLSFLGGIVVAACGFALRSSVPLLGTPLLVIGGLAAAIGPALVTVPSEPAEPGSRGEDRRH